MSVLLALCLTPLAASAQPAVPVAGEPQGMDEVTFEQRLNTQVPLDLTFRDSEGKMVKLGDYLGEKPVLLALVYYECPMLCSLILNGMQEAMAGIAFDPGKEYNVVTVSFDHEETHVLAAEKKANHIESFGREGAEAGWHFLVGEKEPVKQLADAIGFHFKYLPEEDEYAHRAGIVILTPEGKVSRYFPGVQYDPTGLRLGLVEASQNKIGSLVDRLFLLCYHYDPSLGQYSIIVTNVINIACGITVLLLGISLFTLFKLERRTRRLAQARCPRTQTQ